MAMILTIDTIISDQDIKGGQPIIAGTQVRVSDMAASHLYRGLTPDELAVNYRLTLGQVYAALAYYYQHQANIDSLMRQETQQGETYLDRLENDGRLIRIE